MTPRKRHTAPRLPEFLLNRCLAPEERFALTGDLNEEYLLFVRPQRGRLRAGIWYWKQAIASMLPSLTRRWKHRRRRPRTPRQKNGEAMMHGLWQDIRFAARSLRKRLGFTALAVITLALGIGTNIAIFSVINPFLIRPLPFEQPDRLVHLFGVIENRGGFGSDMARVAHADFADYRDEATSFEAFGAYVYSSVIITGTDEPQRTTAGYVTDDLFNILGVRASIGRRIIPGDADEQSERVVVLGDGLWRRSFGADPNIVGQTISLNKNLHTVVGIMPPEFNFPFGGVSMWIPYRVNANAERGVGGLLGVGRLKPGVSIAMAHAEISTIANRLKLEYPETNAEKGARVVGLREGLIFFFDIVRLMFLTLAAAVALVLLIGCANVANLVLAWGTAREREIAVRTALGAGRGRIVRQLLTENALLALMAGVLGTTVAILAVRPIAATMPDDIWRAGNIVVDGTALVFALVVSLGTVFMFGLAPALQSTRTNLANALKEGGRSGGEGVRGKRLSNLLVVGEIGLAIFLLIGAGLLVKSVRNMSHMDLGLVPDQVLTANLTLPRADYQNDADVLTFVKNTLEQLNTASNIENAAAVYPLPMNFESMGTNFTVDGQTEEPDKLQLASAHWATPDYFGAMRIPVLSGRVFTDQDVADAPPVVVINRSLAERHFPGQDPIGRRITLRDSRNDPRVVTVVGVVGNVVQAGLYEAFGPQVYHPFLQAPRRGFYLVVSAKTEPSTAIPTLRSVIRTTDASLPISSVRAMNDVVNESLGPFQGVAAVLTLLAAGALVLAGGGIYGVISYSVSRRVQEFGIRTALGASDRNVIRLVVAQGAKLTAFGIGIGVALAFATTRVLESVLFGVASADATTFVGIPALLAVVALLASYIPARRATRVDPMEALRGE